MLIDTFGVFLYKCHDDSITFIMSLDDIQSSHDIAVLRELILSKIEETIESNAFKHASKE